MNKRIEGLANELTNLCDEENVALVLSIRGKKECFVGIAGTAKKIGNCLLDLDLEIEEKTDLSASIMRMDAMKNRGKASGLDDVLKSIFENLSDDCDCPGCKDRREKNKDDDENEDIDFSGLADAVGDLFKNIFGDKEEVTNDADEDK